MNQPIADTFHQRPARTVEELSSLLFALDSAISAAHCLLAYPELAEYVMPGRVSQLTELRNRYADEQAQLMAQPVATDESDPGDEAPPLRTEELSINKHAAMSVQRVMRKILDERLNGMPQFSGHDLIQSLNQSIESTAKVKVNPPEPAPGKWSDVAGRYGKFRIGENAIQNHPELVAKIMAECIIVRAESMYRADYIEYQALSPQFARNPNPMLPMMRYDWIYDPVTDMVMFCPNSDGKVMV